MNDSQRPQNPYVNSYQPDSGPAETPSSDEPTNPASSGVEEKGEQDVIPVPPDATPAAPVEEPPGSDGPPVGDVDDSPKRIASN
jgi:hypothetical protein